MLFPFIQIESVWIIHRIGMFIPFPKSVLFGGNGGLLPGVHATWGSGEVEFRGSADLLPKGISWILSNC